MTTHITKRAAAIVPVASPIEGSNFGTVVAHRRNAEPEIPVHRGRNRFDRGRQWHALRPDRPIRPAMHFAHRTDQAGFDPLFSQPRSIVGVALIAHLGHHTGLARGCLQVAGFRDGVG